MMWQEHHWHFNNQKWLDLYLFHYNTQQYNNLNKVRHEKNLTWLAWFYAWLGSLPAFTTMFVKLASLESLEAESQSKVKNNLNKAFPCQFSEEYLCILKAQIYKTGFFLFCVRVCV